MNPKDFITPVCNLSYAFITPHKLSTIEENDPRWEITGIIPLDSQGKPTSKEAEAFISSLEGYFDDYKKELKAASPDKKFKLQEFMPFGYRYCDAKTLKLLKNDELSDFQGQPLEAYVIKCKRKQKGVNKKDGSTFERNAPLLADANGVEISSEKSKPLANVDPTSTGKIAFNASPYNHTGSGVGLALNLNAVQVTSFVEYQKQGGSASNPFSKEEGTYTQEDAPACNPFKDPSEGDASTF
tara:strand:- start:9 stop:731 length:723 start_codon:yes stop_codon:yes gene_type:complete